MQNTLFSYDHIDGMRSDITDSHRAIWHQIAQAGAWWTGAERIAIVEESRNARTCTACATRKASLSPETDAGTHNFTTDLSAAAKGAIHRITTDPSRLTRAYIDSLEQAGLSRNAYVELLGVLVAGISIDGFHRAMSLALEELPSPEPGDPSGYEPPGVADSGAWVKTLQPENAGPNETDLYPGGRTGNVISAMSLVPDAVRMLITLSNAHYIPMASVMTPGDNGGRHLSRSQIELLAGRVSSISDCFY